jgi:diadenylate cyclase
MGAAFKDFIGHLRLADLLDVALVAAVLYGLITWMRRTASRRIMAVVGLFVIVYVLARVFEMFLTKMLIEALLAVAFITGIIVFQPDIRRGVDQVGAWLLSRRTNKPRVTSPLLDMLTETAARLAEHLKTKQGLRPKDQMDAAVIAEALRRLGKHD